MDDKSVQEPVNTAPKPEPKPDRPPIFSPKEEPQEQDIHLRSGLSFGDAIEALKYGMRVARAGWNGKDMWLNLQVPDEHSKMSLPYIYMFTAQADQVPWLASQTDMLSEDWVVLSAA